MDAVQVPQQSSNQSRSIKQIAQRFVTAAKHHNQQVNAAYLTYYGVGANYRSSYQGAASTQH
jgi:hypothetical protein